MHDDAFNVQVYSASLGLAVKMDMQGRMQAQCLLLLSLGKVIVIQLSSSMRTMYIFTKGPIL